MVAGIVPRLDTAFAAESANALRGSAVSSVRRFAPLTTEQRERLQRALAPLDRQYDPGEQMLRQPFSSPGYHTTLTGGEVHSTRAALTYAVALLDTGDAANQARAEAILRRVVGLQDQNPEHKTYGIWSWFLEEPLEKMSPPDWNWADFCGTALLQVALDHRERLPADLMAKVDAAIQHAARSIQKRNVGPSYTNIAIMGSYVTLVAAELYGLEDLRAYALARWRRFHEYTFHHGAFAEYNSPTYTIVALKELGRLRQHVQDPEARRLTEEIYRLAWEEIAQHFHAPTRQWAGPHSRSYSTLLRPDVLALIQRATDGRVTFGAEDTSLDEHRLPLPCPPDFEPFFTRLSAPRELRKTFVKTEPPVIGTTYLEPAFTVGTINRGDLWNQRRALVAYWGTAARPSSLQLRFLHDGYDLAAAQFFSAQSGGRVLVGINFAVDGGDRHPSLDRIKDATIRAQDLRVRFELGGAARQARVVVPNRLEDVAVIRWDDLRIQWAAAFATFGQDQGRWEAGKDRDKAWLDLVLYSGAERTIRLAELTQAGVGIALRLSTGDEPAPLVQTQLPDRQLRMVWDGLMVQIPLTPGKASDLQKRFVSDHPDSSR